MKNSRVGESPFRSGHGLRSAQSSPHSNSSKFPESPNMNTTTATVFRTIKSAEAAGFHRMKNYEYGGEQITVKGVLLGRHTQFAQSETAWRFWGRKVISGSKPHPVRTCRVGGGSGVKSVTYAVYRHDQTFAMKRRNPPREAVAHPLTPENVLAAMFSVYRSAKRYRDAAQSCYQSDVHGFARMHRKQKEALYRLKERGLVHAFREGLVVAVGLHGSLTVYRGEGYCFHSPLRPENVMLETTSEESVFVESKPRQSSEMRLMDAVATLEQLVSDFNGFIRHTISTPPKWQDQHWEDDEEEDEDDQYDGDF